ncbi:mevalonate kinase [Vagococcus xieshaowenii]|uniref:Mevalonate kinase n=1 Tax=Vagococcus xieshaowenii TaxID=2562451 RepID=A0AAJ5EDQ3_9ENTE|nr:mevalonate kinase [Vagococcus xieshaowenii]QCA28666.1 mevalonate kinase [Vagococcus xieshaowenii]TFZ40526.1 mevalonate kinase [Vagococcus xieshaowenii]
MSIGIGNSHGKIILMGEHSVVYGKPAIAIPFPSVGIIATVTPHPEELMISCEFYQGLVSEMPELLESLRHVITISLDYLNKNETLSIGIQSTIPAERGMGSSAAVAVATVRGIFDYFEVSLTNELLLSIVGESEKIAHGNPSGLDALMTSSTTPYFFAKNQFMTPFSLNLDACLIVADTGITGQTKAAVAEIASKQHQKEVSEMISRLGELAEASKIYITNNQPLDLGKAMIASHQLLAKLNVSNDCLDQLVKVALNNGAIGAKLTGGGRGGCMIALATSKQEAQHIQKALTSHGAKNTWLYQMGD